MHQTRFFPRNRNTQLKSLSNKKRYSPSNFRQTTASNNCSSSSEFRLTYSKNRSFSQSHFRAKSEARMKIKRQTTSQHFNCFQEDEQKKQPGLLKTISQNYYRPQLESCKRNRTDLKKRFKKEKFRKTSYFKSSSYLNHSNTPSLIQMSLQFDKLEQEFIHCYKQHQFQRCSAILYQLLSYSIDARSKQWFIKVLLKISEFYDSIGDFAKALFYYNQLRESAILLSLKDELILSLIGMSKACTKVNHFMESITILKKALQYSWYYHNQKLQLIVYDQIGKVYYLDGNLEKATAYHEKYMCAKKQSDESPQRILSNQRIAKQQSLNISLKFKELNKLLLVHLDIPIKSTKDLPLLCQKPLVSYAVQTMESENEDILDFKVQSPGQNFQTGKYLRDEVKIDQKYKTSIGNFDTVVKKVFKNWIFCYEMQEPDLQIQESSQKQKFIKGDFKLRKQLKDKGISTHKSQVGKKIVYKQSLDEQVQRAIQEPGLIAEWDVQMVKEVKRDRENKLFKVQNQIRVRDKDKPSKLQVPQIRKLFVSFFS